MAHFQGERSKFFPLNTRSSRSQRTLHAIGNNANRNVIRVQRNLDGTRHHYCPSMYANNDHIKALIYPSDKMDFYSNNKVTKDVGKEDYRTLCDNAKKVRYEGYYTVF